MQRLKNPVFPLTWLLITTILFLLPGAAIPKINWLDKIWFDKWVHIGIFIIIVISWVYSLYSKSRYPVVKLALLIAAFSLLYGVIIELAQHYLVPNRSFDKGDLLADAAGCLIGAIFCRRYIKK